MRSLDFGRVKALSLPLLILTLVLGFSLLPVNSQAEPSVAAKTYHTEGVRQFKAKQFKEVSKTIGVFELAANTIDTTARRATPRRTRHKHLPRTARPRRC